MTHNEKRAHWIKEGAIGLGGNFHKFTVNTQAMEIQK